VEEVLLCVLVDAERDHIQHTRAGNLLDPGTRGLQGWQSEVVADERIGRLPGDAIYGPLWEAGFGRSIRGAAQVGGHFLGRLRAIEDALEEPEFGRTLGHGRGSAERETHARGVQVVGGLGKFAQQSFARLRSQPVGDADERRVLGPCGLQNVFYRDRGTQEHRAPAGLFGQPQKFHDACNMDALAQCCGDNGFLFHHSPHPRSTHA